MSYDNQEYTPKYEVVVSFDGGENYTRYATNLISEEEGREWFDHHCHMLREALRDHRATATIIVELLLNDEPLETATLQCVKPRRPAFVRNDRPELGEMSIAELLKKTGGAK